MGPLYLETVTESLKAAGYAAGTFEFPAGEESKNVSTLSDILEFLARERLTRSDCLIALGVRGFWNFTNVELPQQDMPGIQIEDVHFADSLLTLSYMISEEAQ